MTRKHIISTLAISWIAFTGIRAQVLKDDINVYTGFDPKLAEVEKFYGQPSIPDTFQTKPDSIYSLNVYTSSSQYIPDTLPPNKMKSEPISKLHRFYLKAGFGNYLTPLVDAHIMSLRSRTDAYAFRYSHLSSRGTISQRGFPWMSNNIASGSYAHYFPQHTFSITGKYERNVVHYYGFDPAIDSTITRDSVKQRFNRIDVNAEFASNFRNDSVNVNHRIYANFQHIDDRYRTSENIFSAGVALSRFTDLFARETFGGYVNIKFLNYANDSVGAQNAFFLDGTPYIRFGGSKWGLQLGAKLFLALDDSTRFNVYPDIRFHWNIFRQYIILYTVVDGDFTRNSFYQLSRQNPFIRSTVQLTNMNEWIRGHAGVKGSFTDNISYNAGVRIALADNMPYFVNDTFPSVRRTFDVLYDRTFYFNAFGELSIAFGERLNITGKVNYHLYKPETLTEAWHRPFIDGTISAMYNLRNKLIFKADLFFIGPQMARTFTPDTLNPGNVVMTPVQLGGLVDVNLSAEYRFRKWLSVFVNLNNIAAFRYNRFYEYPTQGFNLIGGLSVAF